MLKLKGAVGAISVMGDPKDFSNSPSLKLKEGGGNPVYLAEIFEAGDGVSIIGQKGIKRRKPTS